MGNDKSLIEIVNPKPNSTVMIYDVHASESGALAILDDFYRQIRTHIDKSVKWIFIVSTPNYEETENIIVRRFPWVKKNWGYRYSFDKATTKGLLKKFKPDKVFSLQNKGIPFYHKEQIVYLHLPFILTDHIFDIRVDGKKLWLYQNVISKSIFRSLRKTDYTIVQTHWMKDALIKKAGISEKQIIIQEPDITTNNIGKYVDTASSRQTFFYPATAFSYKNHMTLLKAINYAQKTGLHDYSLTLTIRSDENRLSQELSDYAKRNNLNVLFIGQIPREKVFEMYANSVLLFPSYVESFGLPLLEAKLTGTYVIASDCPFCREILDGYERAMFFNEMDYETMGKHILKLAGSI